MNSGEQLCLACGLCCDGTLFDNVHLGSGDDPSKLKALGQPIAVARAKTPITHFRQPCAVLCTDRKCRIYADRPLQCRNFECGVFKDAQTGRIEATVALRLVKKARRQADNIRRLLRGLGDTGERRSLGDRFRRVQRRMESSPADEAAAAMFSELGLAVHAFNLVAHEKFYTKAESNSIGDEAKMDGIS